MLRRAAYYRDLALRARPWIDALAGSDAEEKERLARYLDGLEAEALTLEKQAGVSNDLG
jgi:hypothetical protein